MNLGSQIPMAVLPVRLVPDPVLRQKAKRVRAVDASLKKLIQSMRQTMHAVNGVGLAANQVGVPVRVVVIALPEEKDLVLINPQIVKKSGEREITEACLSIPGYHGEIRRAVTVTAKWRDADWKEVRMKATDLLAQALEHEMDHLDGVLYIDHLDGAEKFHKNEPPPEPEPAASGTAAASS